jgi:hypothetical protein
MALGLDIADTQEVILNYLSANKPSAYELLEADIPDSWERAMVNGVAQTTWIVQFSDILRSADSESFCGPRSAGYYSLFRVFSLASNPRDAHKANSVANGLMLGFSGSNIGSVAKESGGGSFGMAEANSRPAVYGIISNFRYATNLADVGSGRWPVTS